MPAIREGMRRAGCDEGRLMVLNVQKRHNTRLYPAKIQPGAKAPDQNLKPGTVIDHTVVDPAAQQFYLNSHRTIQVRIAAQDGLRN